MTLIAAFWCLGDNAVLCADSCESYGEYKTSVTKLRPLGDPFLGKYQLAYAGAGLADLVDALGEKIEQSFASGAASDWLSLQQHLQSVLSAFYASPTIKSYPLDPNDANSYVSGIVCVRVVPLQKVFLFKFSKTVVLPVRDFVLRGFEAPIYSRVVKRLYPTPLLPLHAQLVGLRVLSEAASTSTAVDAPFTTVFAMTHGMFESSRNHDLYLKALANTESAMNQALIACVDTHAVSDTQARDTLKELTCQILGFRREHKRALKIDFKKQRGTPMGPRIPLG